MNLFLDNEMNWGGWRKLDQCSSVFFQTQQRLTYSHRSATSKANTLHKTTHKYSWAQDLSGLPQWPRYIIMSCNSQHEQRMSTGPVDPRVENSKNSFIFCLLLKLFFLNRICFVVLFRSSLCTSCLLDFAFLNINLTTSRMLTLFWKFNSLALSQLLGSGRVTWQRMDPVIAFMQGCVAPGDRWRHNDVTSRMTDHFLLQKLIIYLHQPQQQPSQVGHRNALTTL